MRNLCNNLALVSAVVMASLTSVPASADPAFVLNSGRDGLLCEGPLDTPLDGFSGHATLVTTSSGQIMVRCNGSVIGEPPENTIVFSDEPGPITLPPTVLCNSSITKSGRFNATCHN